ncbi:hypothetical protein [Spirochaeta isovalerica]|uniref:Uncharacterized protein n=1 Tax=Spirochaeta isovalerica TaxID=150 RepID=A0A841R6S1_9SPIO|nr:hypothetical protein [Spirochaeta isovalerica]MBB6478740.1 hypothetical protein [Spirochaeta isovalerica]
MNGLQTLKLNKKAFKLYQKARKLPKWSKETRNFMIKSAENVPITSRDLLNLYEILIFIVENTEIFPEEAQFRIKNGNKVIYLNSAGEFLEQRLLNEDKPLKGHMFNGPIHLSPGLEMKPVDFSTFISGYFRGHISAAVLKDLCSVPEPLKVVWNIPLIRTIYLRFSLPKWESPLEAMNQIQTYLIENAFPRSYVRLIENCLVNNGRMGFSPPEVLNKIVMVHLERYGDNPESFKEAMTLQWSMTRRLNALFGKENDGTTFNQYSLRKLIIPLLSPDSRFTKEVSLAETDRLFRDVAIRWKEVMTEPYKYTKDIFDNYGDLYITSVCRIEKPEIIRREIIRLLNHIDFISSRISDEKQYTRFLKPLHVQGVEEIRKKSISGNIQATMRLVMQKHFELIEEYTILDYPIDYRQYMTFFSGGFIKSPEDIDFFQNAVRKIRQLNSTETDEILKVMMLYASDVKETQKIIDYISSCKVFDREIFQKWKELHDEKQDEAIYSLNKTFDKYILDPTLEISVKELPKVERIIENAIIKQVVRSPRINRQEIEEMLNSETTAMEPAIPDGFEKPEEVTLTESLYGNRSSSDQQFLAARQRYVGRAYSMRKDELYRDRLASSIIKAGVYYYGESYGDNSVDIMNNFQLFTGEINNLTGKAGEVGRECASWILLQEKELAEKTISLIEELAISGLISQAGLTELAYPPFSDIMEKRERDSFSIENLLNLKEIYGIYLNDYINNFCINETALLPPVARTLFQKSFPGTETMMECAGIILKNLRENLNVQLFDEEQDALVRGHETGESRKLTIVGGKRKIDQFFHLSGHSGYRNLFSEIKRKDFVPFRIIDNRDMKIAGYISILMGFRSNSRGRLMIISGIHVQEKWLSKFNPVFFYREIRKALVNFAKRVDADMLCVTLSGVNHSGNSSLRSLMRADLEGKPITKTSAVQSFPEKSFSFNEVAVLWKKKNG